MRFAAIVAGCLKLRVSRKRGWYQGFNNGNGARTQAFQTPHLAALDALRKHGHLWWGEMVCVHVSEEHKREVRQYLEEYPRLLLGDGEEEDDDDGED